METVKLCQTIHKDLRIIARARANMTPEEQERMMNMLRTSFEAAFADAESDGIYL